MSTPADIIEFLGEDDMQPGTERVPGAARNERDGMPTRRVPYAKALRAIDAPSPTVPKNSPWEEHGPAEEASNRSTPAHAPVVVLPKPTFSASRSELLQQWEGTVIEVDSTQMKVALRSLMENPPTEEQATIDLDQVPDADRSLVAEGAVFYWSIGYRVEPHGQKTLTSNIRFRRLPAWTATEAERAKREASKFDELFAENEG